MASPVCCWSHAPALAIHRPGKPQISTVSRQLYWAAPASLGVGAMCYGTLIGALIVGVFRNGLQLMGVPSIYQVLITGILVILSVSVDQISHRGQA